MIWKALMKDGSTVFQEQNGKEIALKDLDTSNLSVFSIIDSLHSFVNLDLCNGSFDLNNLDLMELSKLLGGEIIELKYSADDQKFKMTSDSLEFLNSLVLKDERSNYIGFDQSGKFSINGIPFYIGFEVDGVFEEFANQPPYNKVIQFNDAVTDFLGSSTNRNPYKRVDAVLAYSIGYTKEHVFNTTTFNLSLVLKYDIVQKCVSLNCLITANEDISGKLVVVYGNNKSGLAVNLTKNETASLNRIITLM